MTFSFKVVIPSRYAATRLPGKPLAEIGEKKLIQHVFDSARASRAQRVIIATDDGRIEDAARAFGAEVMMTSSAHACGTDRIAEVVARLNEPDDAIIVNVQGDWCGLTSVPIDQVALALYGNPRNSMATLCKRITSREEWRDPNAVKVVRNEDGRAAYFSRAPIPWSGDTAKYGFRHIGIYAYRADFLRWFALTRPCELELSERLEQLRALYHGHDIYVEETSAEVGVEVNSQDDLERARRRYGTVGAIGN